MVRGIKSNLKVHMKSGKVIKVPCKEEINTEEQRNKAAEELFDQLDFKNTNSLRLNQFVFVFSEIELFEYE